MHIWARCALMSTVHFDLGEFCCKLRKVERLEVGGPEQRRLEPRRVVDAATREPESRVMSPGFAQRFVRVSQ